MSGAWSLYKVPGAGSIRESGDSELLQSWLTCRVTLESRTLLRPGGRMGYSLEKSVLSFHHS